jgi:hypothetical protein
MTDTDLYVGREQTLVKHFILRHYLERFAHIVGTHWDTITYVDCFSGPWNVRSEELKDSSFSLALDELRKARESLSQGSGAYTGCSAESSKTTARTRHPQSREAKADEEIRYREQTCWLRPARGFPVMARWRLEFGRAARRDSTDCILFGRGFADCSRLHGSHVSASRASWVAQGTASENRTPRAGAAMQQGSGHSAITPEGRRGSWNR